MVVVVFTSISAKLPACSLVQVLPLSLVLKIPLVVAARRMVESDGCINSFRILTWLDTLDTSPVEFQFTPPSVDFNTP